MGTQKLLAGVWIWFGLAGLTAAQERIMTIGDSITHGYPSTEASYRLFLWDLLTAQSRSFRFVGHRTGNYGGEGISYSPITTGHAFGWPIAEQQHAAVAGIFASQYAGGEVARAMNAMGVANRPDIVLLHIGHNDMGFGGNAPTTRNYIGSIMDQIRAYNPNATFVLSRLIPAGFPTYFNSTYYKVSELNALMPALAASKSTPQSPVFLVDLNSGFPINDFLYPETYEPINNATLTPDRVHPNPTGQAEMARRWFRLLNNILAPPIVQITAPANGSATAEGTSITVDVNTLDADGNLQSVSLWANGLPAGTQTTAPFRFTVPVTTTGPILLSARGTDANGQETVSPPVVVNSRTPDEQSALTSLRAWYRSDNGVEVVGGRVRRWRDLSGNNFHLFQRNAANRPEFLSNRFLDKPGLVFDGQRFMSSWDGMPVNSDYTQVVVFKLGSYGNPNNLLSAGTVTSGSHALWFHETDRARLYRFGQNPDPTVSFATASTPTPLNQATTLTATYDRASRLGRIHQDNAFIGDGTAFRDNTAASFQLGAFSGGFTFVGEVAEVLIYDRQLNTAERTALQNYLDHRYKSQPNHPPKLGGLPVVMAHPGDDLMLAIPATDPDAGQRLGFSIADAPPGATLHPTNGVFAWAIPTNTLPGNFAPTITVTDNGTPQLSDSETLPIQVVALPEFTTLIPTNGMHQLNWTGIDGRMYELESTTNLSNPVWNPLGSQVPPGGLLAPDVGFEQIFRLR